MIFLLENYNIEIVIKIWITLKLYLLKLIYGVSILILELSERSFWTCRKWHIGPKR
jgi:hypothetical protein